MRSLKRTLPGAALALALCGCGGGLYDLPGDGPGTRTAFIKLGGFTRPLPPSPSASPSESTPAPLSPSGTPTASPSPTVSAPPPPPDYSDLRGTRLGPSGDTDRMYERLKELGVNNLPRVREALSTRPPKDEVGLAFVLGGCANTGARLEVEGRTVSASLTGGENVNCDQAEHFLVTFRVAEDKLPEGWVLRHGPR
ncbi:hypothetical protein ACIBKX_08160 [Streptomyces sp. NPDC050658]|uniref:hypothetical protein n=1 Tax=unclassified Streptomyces TaxID=2593676 RepID=UPI0034426516